MGKLIYIAMLIVCFVGKVSAQSNLAEGNGKKTLYILNGLITTPEKIDSTKVKGMWVFKDRIMLAKYGEAGRNGIIIISTNSSKISKVDTSASNYPLILVDSNEVYSEDMKKIFPNIIDNVQVIKDAKARDLYGFKGAKGVVIVTTKKENKIKH